MTDHEQPAEDTPYRLHPAQPRIGAAITATNGLLPGVEEAYLAQIVRTLQDHLNQWLVGVYLFGSAAYGDYEPGTSDLDVQAVTRDRLSPLECQELTQRLTHSVLPCPARRLEFVCYAQSAINPSTRHPQFEINFNTGAGETDHLTLDPTQESSHWFLLDLALGRELGRSLLGPAPAQVFGAIPRLWQLEAIADSLLWHQAHELTSANSVLNACRGWRYAATGQFGSKLAGAAWARQQPECPPVVELAVQRRPGGPALPSAAVAELMTVVSAAVQRALAEACQRS